MFGISENLFPIALIVLGALFLLGLYLSFSSRSTRTRRADALGDNALPRSALKVGKILVAPIAARTSPARAAAPAPVAAVTSVPLVQNTYARSLSVLWIAATIVVNVIALAKLLQEFGLAYENWHQPFVWLSNVYDGYAGQAFTLTSASVSQQFGVRLPAWVLPLFVLYVASASAFVVASTGLMKRDSNAEELFGAVIHAGWVFAVPAFVLDAVRYHVVTRFARQNTVLFFAYAATLLVAYVVARFINDDILPGLLHQYGAATASAISQHASDAAAISKNMGKH
jgi:hypothetical protein